MTAPPAGWLACSFGHSTAAHQARLDGAIDHAARIARRAGRRIDVSGRDPRERLWRSLASIGATFPELAAWLECGSIRGLRPTQYSPQPLYHQAGLLIAALLFPRVSVAISPSWESTLYRPEPGGEETLVLHPEVSVFDAHGHMRFWIDTRITLRAGHVALAELYDECDPSSTHGGRHAHRHADRRQELAALGIVPLSSCDAWLDRLGERWEALYAELRGRASLPSADG